MSLYLKAMIWDDFLMDLVGKCSIFLIVKVKDKGRFSHAITKDMVVVVVFEYSSMRVIKTSLY